MALVCIFRVANGVSAAAFGQRAHRKVVCAKWKVLKQKKRKRIALLQTRWLRHCANWIDFHWINEWNMPNSFSNSFLADKPKSLSIQNDFFVSFRGQPCLRFTVCMFRIHISMLAQTAGGCTKTPQQPMWKTFCWNAYQSTHTMFNVHVGRAMCACAYYVRDGCVRQRFVYTDV